MIAGVVTVHNPFDPQGSRELRWIRRRRRIRALAPQGGAPVIALLNGRPLRRVEWRRKLAPGDQLLFCVLPRGGGGGGGSNPLRAILSLAVLVFAPWASGALLGAVGANAGATLIGSFTLGQATTLGIALAGNALVNAVLPVPQPGRVPQASPTYSLVAQGNSARIDAAIPVQYGRLLAYPDFAAQPYVEFAGNEQYLYQLLCLGCGDYDIEEIRIEDTEISAFSEIEVEVVRPGEAVTLFPTSVTSSVEVSGLEMPARASGSWVWSGSTITITEPGHGRVTGQAVDLEFTTGAGPDGKYEIGTVIDADTWTVAAASGSGSGALFIRAVLGGLDGYVAAAAGTVAHRIALDLVLPGGLHSVLAEGGISDNSVQVIFEARRIDDTEQPLGPWFQLGDETITDRTTTPVRRSFHYDLDVPGRYRVRAWRVSLHHPSTGAQDQVLLAGLRSYLRETEDFGPVTLLAMRMRATNNLSQQASRKVSVIATRKLAAWNGTGWSEPEPTRSIAWAIADAARNPDYGAGLPDTMIDTDALAALDALWAARGDHLDGRFDQAVTWWEAASLMARAGRARIFLQGGRLRVVRDGPEALPVALFSMRNIRKGSFSVDYLMPGAGTADAVRVKYFDATTWQPRRVVAALPGSSQQKVAELDLSNVVSDRAQALREGLYEAASNARRRRIVRFRTEMEGFIPSLGDLIAVSHDVPAWGQQAEVLDWRPSDRWLRLSEPLAWSTGTHYAALRRPDGSVAGPYAATPGAGPAELHLGETPDFEPETGAGRARTHIAFGPADRWAALAKVAAVRPRGLHEVELEAVVEDASVHAAETGAIAPPIRYSQLPRRAVKPVVQGLVARRMPDDNIRALLAWQPAPGAESYQVEMAEGADPSETDVSWTRIADTTAAHLAIPLLYSARTMIRVRGVGLAAGPWVAASLGDLIPDFWNTSATPMWTADSNTMWSS